MISNDTCRKCESCGLPIKDIFIARCPRCNTYLEPISRSCEGCVSKNTCSLKIEDKLSDKK